MSHWLGIALFFAALVASIAIRAPHERRSKSTKIAQSRKGSLENALLGLMGVAVLALPLIFATSNWLSFADYPLTSTSFTFGAIFVALWLWLFYRSHADLGTNWSVSLELREDHRLITNGVYARVRHPMYTSLFCHAAAQGLLLANWIAGPAMLVAFTQMFLARFTREERMMREKFGEDYAGYSARTKRLVPGIW